jgi:hypothetical protein
MVFHYAPCGKGWETASCVGLQKNYLQLGLWSWRMETWFLVSEREPIDVVGRVCRRLRGVESGQVLM